MEVACEMTELSSLIDVTSKSISRHMDMDLIV